LWNIIYKLGFYQNPEEDIDDTDMEGIELSYPEVRVLSPSLGHHDINIYMK